MLTSSLAGGANLAQASAGMSRIVVAEHPEVTDGVRFVNADIVQTMLDESMKRLTNEATVADAWASILPGLREEHLVSIKVNPLDPMISTRPELVNAIVSGLASAGVPENNVIVYDKLTSYLCEKLDL